MPTSSGQQFIREKDIVKQVQRSSFKFNPIATAIAIAITSQFSAQLAQAGSGFGNGVDTANKPTTPVTYYANSPAGPVPQLTAGKTSIVPQSGLPTLITTGTALRKFVDTLPGLGATNANNLNQYIPVAVAEKWVDLNGNPTNDDYYEIAAVEYSEKMHSDLPKATHLRGYVQLSTATNPGKHIQLFYPAVGAAAALPILDTAGQPVYAYDNPHHLGPVINSTKGTAVRVKFTNLLPIGAGGKLFIPVDTTITGAGVGPDGVTSYTQNRAEMHLIGGQAPWISAGNPHQWVAPAGEATSYTKGVSTQNVPDMADPGPGATTLYFPNDLSARFTFYQDRTSGLTRLNSYAGLEAGYFVTDAAEQALVSGGTLNGVTFAAGTIPADQIPLIIEDKTFVPANIAQQDAKWDTTVWGQPGDLWFPHVYETNQDPKSVNGVNPVGRWDYGPLFWPIFPVDAAKAALPATSFTPEAYMDTPVINGTAYPTLTVDPKAYRFRILNASNDRYINLGLYKADPSVKAPQLDANGNPTFDAAGNQLFFTNTEVKMVPAAADIAGNPPGWDAVNGVQLPLPQFLDAAGAPILPWNINAEPSGPSRAWPVDGRAGGAPDPATSGPDFVVIGNDGGLLPHAVDIPSQPVTYESNRRSITVLNIYGYGMLLGPAERSDAVVDFSAYAGQTLILYNDAPAPTPFNDPRNDYYTGNPDLTGQGGAYTTQPGYGPNTRTMMQIKVNAAPAVAAPAFDAAALASALPLAYGLGQTAPIVPAVAYNASFNTTDADIYGHVATGSIAQPNLEYSSTGVQTVTGVNLITSGGTVVAGGAVVGNAIPGTGTGYDPLNPPTVVFDTTCGTGAAATAVVDATTHQVTSVTLASPYIPAHTVNRRLVPASGGYPGYTCAPLVTFTNPAGTSGVGAQVQVVTTNFNSVPVVTKAEQELFDDYGRYNSTGGVELPMTSGVIQTTIPLSYIDSPTEIIKDGETQIWKLVDNGFWSNSIRFDMVEVQLINRVGWDGTVKAPATNEVGWKDTVRLNPLEDVLVAMRPKNSTVPFGLPKSSRLQDPSKAAGAVGSGLGFLADPGVLAMDGVTPLLTTTVNVTADYDNEFTWGSALLSHAEDDFTRPVMFSPTVTTPSAPTGLGLNAATKTLTWIDPTPAGQLASAAGVVPVVAATLANPRNEIGFKVSRAPISNNTVGAYGLLANVQANVTSYVDAGYAAGTEYAYQVAAWNGAGAGTASYAVLNAPAPTAWVGAPVINTGNNNKGTVTLSWTVVPGATGYVITATNVATGAQLTLTVATNVGTTTTTLANLPIGAAYSLTVATQRSIKGLAGSATSAPSAAVAVDLSLPAVPALAAPSAVTTTGMTLTWASVTGATGLALQYSNNGGRTWTPMPTTGNGIKMGAALTAGSLSAVITGLQPATSYSFQLTANNAIGSALPATVTQATLALTPVTPAVTTAGLTASGFTLNFATANATNYIVSVNGVAQPSQAGTSFVVTGATPGTSYGPYTVTACSNGGTTCSAASAPKTVITPPEAPVAPTVASVASTTLTLNWTAAAGAASYTVQRATNAGFTQGVNTVATGLTSNSYAVTALNANTTYYFRLQAVNGANTVSGPASAAVLTAPAAPAFTAATAVSTTGFTANWNAPTGATSYIVTVNGVAQAAQTTTSFAVTGATAGASTMITVVACSTGGATCSNPASLTQATLPATPAAPTVTNVAATGLTVNWTAVTGATNYSVQRATVANGVVGAFGNATTVNAVAGVLPTSLAVTGLTGNTTYVFQVRATDAAGNSGYSSSSASQLTLPSAPTGVLASNGSTGAPITGGLTFTPVAGVTYVLNWTAPTGVMPNTGTATVTTSGQQVTFGTAGNYSMTLTATNASGSSTSAAVNVTVR